MNSTAGGARNWISAIIGIIVLVVIVWLAPSPHFMPRGLFLPAQKTFLPNTSGTVTFYAEPPQQYQQVGLIRIARHYNQSNTRMAQQQIIAMAKALAAKHGANGVIVKLFAHSMPGVTPAAQAMYSFMGIAIHTNSTFGAFISPSTNENVMPLGGLY